ncbi:MAG: hypothetical protein Q9178_003822 [Gyalolechia marmorata]
MSRPKDRSDSPDGGGTNDSSDQARPTNPTSTSHSFARVNRNLAETGVEPFGTASGPDLVAPHGATKIRFNSAEMASRTTTALGTVVPAMIQRLNNIDRQVREHHIDLYDLDNRFKDFSADIDEITEYHGLRHPRHRTRGNRPGSSHSLSSMSTDDNNLPAGITAQIVYLDRRINSLEAHFQPNSPFLTHVDGLVTHINRVATQLNIISSNTDGRFALLTDAHTKHSQEIVAHQTELEQRLERRIQHQTTRFMDRVEKTTVDFRARINTTNEVLDQITTTFNRLHVEDLGAQVQSNCDTLQELSNRLTHISESIHQELENIRANTHAAAATMSARTPPQPSASTPLKGHHSPPAPSSILDSPVPEALFSMETQTTQPVIEVQSNNHPASSVRSSAFEELDSETRALVMHNDIGLSKIMTSDDSYWSPRNVARRAADIRAAAAVSSAGSPILTNEQRTRLFKERSAKAGIRLSAPKSLRTGKDVAANQEGAYGGLDRFEQLLEEKSLASHADTEGVFAPNGSSCFVRRSI